MVMAGPPCARCGWTLRWFQPQFAWVCDRCRSIFPSGPPRAAAPAAYPAPAAYAAPAAYPAPAGHPLAGPSPGMVGAGYSGARPRKPFKLPSKTAMIAGGSVAVAVIVALVVWRFVLAGSSSGGPGSSREDLIRRAVAALAAHDADQMMSLADYDSLRDRMLKCEDTDHAKRDRDRNKRELQENFEKEVERTKKVEIKLGSLKKDDDGGWGYGGSGYDRPTRLEKGEDAGDDCKFKIDAAFHNIDFTVKVTVGDRTHEQDVSMMALEVDGSWYLISPPRIEGEIGTSDCKTAVDTAMKLSKDEMMKLPNMTESKLDSLTTDIAELCDLDHWEEDVRTCLSEAMVSNAVEACMRKLSSSQQSNVTDKIMRATEY